METICKFLPITLQEASKRGWEELDFVLVTGDAYVDHPSFGAAVISRVLEQAGFRIGIIAQPDWKNIDDFRILGKPRLAFLVTAGNVDSMVNHYSAAGNRRKKDAYSPGGKPGLRPDRATIVYTNCVKQAFKGVPVIIGGLEASLRRMGHYDYWTDSVRRSILLDAKADLLVYGMGENTILEIGRRLNRGEPAAALRNIRGTVYWTSSLEGLQTEGPSTVPPAVLPAFEEIRGNRNKFAESFRIQYQNSDPVNGRLLAEPYEHGYVIQNPPALPLNRSRLDSVYGLPYTRDSHPKYRTEGEFPALTEVRFSITHARGCFGDCSFCSLTFHQGRIVQSRSHKSVLQEAEILVNTEGFKGYIHDVGGPTANFRSPACQKQPARGSCRDRRCLIPEPCPNLIIDHSDYLSLLTKLRSLSGIKKVFIRSGIRFDYLLADKNRRFFTEMCRHHISGQLKAAPEHVSKKVLRLMGKPTKEVYEEFRNHFSEINRSIQKKQYLLPYFIIAHPGSDLLSAVELAEYFRDTNFIPKQMQEFYPTPGTLSTCMYHTGTNPLTGEAVYSARGNRERSLHRALSRFTDPENRKLVVEALTRVGRTDLIGRGKKCLVRQDIFEEN